MKVLVQRSLESSVSVDGMVTGSINNGLVLLVSFSTMDTADKIDPMIKKVVNLRIFDDEEGNMNKSILDVGGEVLSISQFTLYADTRKGNRPSYMNAMKSDEAKKLYDLFNEKLSDYVKTYTGVFGADMKLNILNDGPVTIMLEV